MPGRREEVTTLHNVSLHPGFPGFDACNTGFLGAGGYHTTALNGDFLLFECGQDWAQATDLINNIWHFTTDFVVPLMSALVSLPNPNQANLQVILVDRISESPLIGWSLAAYLNRTGRDYPVWWLNEIFPKLMPNLTFADLQLQSTECVHFHGHVSYARNQHLNVYGNIAKDGLPPAMLHHFRAWHIAREHLHRMLSLPTALPRPERCLSSKGQKHGQKPLKVLIIQRGARGFANLETEVDVLHSLRPGLLDIAVVDMAELSPPEQLAVAFSADITLAGHGAGLSNSVYQMPGTETIQVIAAQHCVTDWARMFTFLFFVTGTTHVNYCSPLNHIARAHTQGNTNMAKAHVEDANSYENWARHEFGYQQGILHEIVSYTLTGSEMAGIFTDASARLMASACHKVDGLSISGYTHIVDAHQCSSVLQLSADGPEWESAAGISACANNCNSLNACNAFEWFDDFGCRTFTACESAELDTTEAEVRSYVFRKNYATNQDFPGVTR